MHFAKLFTYGDGQLLVIWKDSDDADREDAPYLITTETRRGIVTNRLEHGYSSKEMRDADFDSFNEQKAADYYSSQQQFLAKMAS